MADQWEPVFVLMNPDFRLCLRLCRDESPWQEIPKNFLGGRADFGAFWGVSQPHLESARGVLGVANVRLG